MVRKGECRENAGSNRRLDLLLVARVNALSIGLVVVLRGCLREDWWDEGKLEK